jgi:hypothetical protein
MQVNKFLSKLPAVELPPAGSKPNNTNGAKGALGSSLAPTSSVVVSIINRAASAPVGALTVSSFLANMSTLTAPVNIADSAANIAKNLNALNAAGALAKIGNGTVSQLGTPTDLSITYDQWLADTTVAANGTSILEKLGAQANPAGSNNVRVSSVDDSNLATVEADPKVIKVGVTGVAKSDLSARLNDSQISTIGVGGLSKDDLLPASNYYNDLRNVKVTSIGVVDVPSANLNAVLTNTKVKSVTVTGVLAKDVASVGSRPQVSNMTVADSSVNLATNFNALINQQNKISTVTQSPKTVMGLTGGQFKAGTSILAKFDSADYTVNLKSVLASDASGLISNSKVLDIQITDSGLNIGRNFSSLGDAKITKISQASLKDSVTISAAQYASGTAILGKMTAGSYSLALTGYTFTNAGDLTTLTSSAAIKTVSLAGLAVSDLTTVVANPKVSAIQISDTATNINNSILTLRANIAKIGVIDNKDSISGTRPNIVFTPTTYDSKLADKLSGFSTVVDYDNVAHTNNSSLYSITSDANGVRTVAQGNVKKSYSNNVNFFKFSDKNLFGTTGNKNVDAILLGGTKNWWYDTTAAATSDVQINGGMNALTSSASKHNLTFSFLNSGSISGASNQASDSNGFVEMSADQKVAVKKALDYISTVTNLTFTEANTSGQGDLNFGTNDQGTASGAYAYNPHTAPHIDVMLNNHAGAAQQANSNFAQGSYGWETLIHEIAHSIGLKHPGNYNAGGGGTVGPYLPAGDAGSRRFSIMSYNNPTDGQNVTATDNGNNTTTYSASALNPDTFMVYDIAALQFLYGVNTNAAGSKLQSNQTETASAIFKPMIAGKTLTLAGLTFTAGTSGATKEQVAKAFSSITSGISAASLNTAHSLSSGDATKGGWFSSGQASGWTSGSTITDAVVFTSTTANTNVQDLAPSGNAAAPTITKSDGVRVGVTESASIVFSDLTLGQTMTLAGLTFTAGANGATKEQLATAFSNATAGISAASLNTLHSLDDAHGGTFTSGSASGWTSGSASTDTVVFTSTIANANVDNLTSAGTGTAPVITRTQGVGVTVDDFQTTVFTSGWKGYESLYVPASQSSENLNLSSVSNKNIIDLRDGSFSSINVLPPETKNSLPTSMLQSAQTYFGMNNVALAYGSEVNAITGGSGKDTYYVSDYNVTITDSSSANQVFLNGSANDWSSSTSGGTTTYTNANTQQTVALVGAGFTVSYYDANTKALTHNALDLMA